MAACTLGAAIIVCAAAAPARAQQSDLERGRAAFFDANFRRARDLLTRALDDPRLTREAATETYRFLATVELLLGRPDRARGDATRAVALDPRVSAPEGAGSRASRLFDDARATLDGAALALDVESVRERSVVRVTARLTPDVADLVGHIRLRCVPTRGGSSGARSTDSRVADQHELELELDPAGGSWRCVAVAETSAGATLLRTEHRSVRAHAAGPRAQRAGHGPDGGSSSAGDGMPLWPWLVGAGALVVGAVVVGVAVAAGDDEATIELGPIEVNGW